MNKYFTGLLVLALLAGCSSAQSSAASFQQITQEEAMRIMEEETGYILLDVRTLDEYNESHIPGAICIPNEHINSTPPSQLPDKSQTILVYCRSGNRSKQAAQKLADMGYTDIREFGGIMTWTGKTESAFDPVLMLDRREAKEQNGIIFEVTGYDKDALTAKFTNNSEETFSYGEPFELYRKDNNEWKSVEWEEERMWIMIAYELSPGESKEIRCSLAGAKNIDSGEYMLEKNGLQTEFTLVYSE